MACKCPAVAPKQEVRVKPTVIGGWANLKDSAKVESCGKRPLFTDTKRHLGRPEGWHKIRSLD
eukprot:357678-Amphidinium_carterae.1